MAGNLSDLLGISKPEFNDMIGRLEAGSHHPNVDIKLSSKIANNVATKIKELCLDPNDTNGTELYQALQILTKQHDVFLTTAIAGSPSVAVAELLPLIIAKIAELPGSKSCWALKHSTAKKLLKNMPPKKLMKHLGYRSVDSMLKRENPDVLFIGLRLTESATWLSRFIRTYKKLGPVDFETRTIKLINLTTKKWQKPAYDYIQSSHHNLVDIKEMGVIGVLPLDVQNMPGLTITILPVLIHLINEIRIYSAYFKLHQVRPGFSTALIDMLMNESKNSFQIANQPIHWRSIHKRFGKTSPDSHPAIFEPYLQPEDLAWRSAEDTIYKLEPALKFWDGLDYTAMIYGDQIIPLGLMDNAISYCNGLAYGQQTFSYFRNSLKTELFSRYLTHQPLEEQIIKQLDTDLIDAESMLVSQESF